jgi:hypothetical protein
MHPRARGRWLTHFGRWVDVQTVPVVVVTLRDAGFPITNGAVYNWLAGRSLPSIEQAHVLVENSRGRLKLADLVEHRRAISP